MSANKKLASWLYKDIEPQPVIMEADQADGLPGVYASHVRTQDPRWLTSFISSPAKDIRWAKDILDKHHPGGSHPALVPYALEALFPSRYRLANTEELAKGMESYFANEPEQPDETPMPKTAAELAQLAVRSRLRNELVKVANDITATPTAIPRMTPAPGPMATPSAAAPPEMPAAAPAPAVPKVDHPVAPPQVGAPGDLFGRVAKPEGSSLSQIGQYLSKNWHPMLMQGLNFLGTPLGGALGGAALGGLSEWLSGKENKSYLSSMLTGALAGGAAGTGAKLIRDSYNTPSAAWYENKAKPALKPGAPAYVPPLTKTSDVLGDLGNAFKRMQAVGGSANKSVNDFVGNAVNSALQDPAGTRQQILAKQQEVARLRASENALQQATDEWNKDERQRLGIAGLAGLGSFGGQAALDGALTANAQSVRNQAINNPGSIYPPLHPNNRHSQAVNIPETDSKAFLQGLRNSNTIPEVRQQLINAGLSEDALAALSANPAGEFAALRDHYSQPSPWGQGVGGIPGTGSYQSRIPGSAQTAEVPDVKRTTVGPEPLTRYNPKKNQMEYVPGPDGNPLTTPEKVYEEPTTRKVQAPRYAEITPAHVHQLVNAGLPVDSTSVPGSWAQRIREAPATGLMRVAKPAVAVSDFTRKPLFHSADTQSTAVPHTAGQGLRKRLVRQAGWSLLPAIGTYLAQRAMGSAPPNKQDFVPAEYK